MAAKRQLVHLRIGIAMVAMFLVVGIVDSPCFTFYRISGNSMRPSFLDGDRVVVTNVPFVLGGPDVGDAVIARHDGEVLIKRVMAVPGDVLEIRGGVVLVDGVAVDDTIPTEMRDHASVGPIVLGPGEYYLLGDNRRVSVDSRSFGPVSGDSIVGLVCVRIKGTRDDPAVTAAATR